MDPRAKAYFQKSVLLYSKGDIENLLKSKLTCAGPLLATILTGIDNLGGMCYGFDGHNVGKRSTRFMTEKMGFSDALATFLYESIRCGIVHQGMPKMGLEFYVQYEGSNKGVIFYSASEKYIILNVTELAHLYLKTIEKIEAEPDKHIGHYPQYTEDKKNALKANFEDARKDIASGNLIYTRRQFENDEHKRTTTGQSSAAYTGEMQYFIDLPPEDK
jgi:hypothetical protein